MNESIVLLFGLIVGFVFIRKYLFLPPKKNKKGFRKRYEARKKEKDAREKSLHKVRR